MKFTNSGIMDQFFEAIDRYEGRVELIVGNKVRLNLKATLSRIISMLYLLEQTDLSDVKIITDCAAVSEQMMQFITQQKTESM